MTTDTTRIHGRKVTLTNEFHNTSATCTLKPADAAWNKYGPCYIITRRTALRLRRLLCGSPDCCCGDTFGARGASLQVMTESYDGDYVVRIRE